MEIQPSMYENLSCDAYNCEKKILDSYFILRINP